MIKPASCARSLFIAVASLLLVQCDNSSSGGAPTSPGSGEAVDLAPGAPLNHPIPGDSARDTLRATFHCDSGSTCEIQVRDSTGGLTEYVVDPSGLPVYAIDASVAPKVDRLLLPAPSTGTYTLVVVGRGGTPVSANLVTTPGYPSNYVLPDAWEPDNSLSASRTAVADSQWRQRTLHSGTAPDVDWFAADLDSGWTYTFQRLDSIRLYASTATAWTTDSVMIAEPSIGDVVVPAFGATKVRFRIDGDEDGVRYRWRLVARRGLPEGGVSADAWESDDARATARSLPTDSSVRRATLHGQGRSTDVDWIRIAVDSGKTYQIALLDSSSYMAISVIDADSAPVPADVVRSGRSTRISIPSDRAGSWWIRLSGTVPTRYSIAVSDTAGLPVWYDRDAWESDDAIARAKTLLPGSARQARTLHRNPGGNADIDWISVRVDSGTTLRLVLEAGSGLPTHALHDSAGKILKPETHGGSAGSSHMDTLLWPSLRTESVFLRVDGTASVDSYRVAAAIVPGVPSWMLPEPGEPDSGIATAGTISELPSVLKRRLVRGDVDWIRVPVPAWSRVVVTARALATGQGGGWIQPLDAAGRPVGDSTSLQGTASVVLDASSLTDSVAYLRIRGSIDSGAMLPYELRDSVVHYVPDSCEPNQDRAHATRLAGREAYLKDLVTSNFDDDWYVFAVSAGEAVQLGAWSESQTLSIELFEGDQPRRSGDTARVAGTWFAHVRGSATKVSSYRLYMERLVVQMGTSDSIRDGAMRIPSDSQSVLCLLRRGETRWLRYDAHAGHTYVLSKRNADDSYRTLPSAIRIENAQGDSIGNLGGGYSGWWTTAKEDGPVYIRLSQTKDTADFSQRLCVHEIPFDPDSLLPKGTPRLLPLDSSWSPYYHNPPGDTDVFEIRIRAGYGYDIFSSFYSANWAEVVDAKGAPFLVQTNNGENSNLMNAPVASFRATSDGSIFVRKVWDLGFPEKCWYRMAAKEYPPSALEPPHAKTSTALALSPGDSVGFTLLGIEPRIYALTLDSGAVVRFSGDGDSGIYVNLMDKSLFQSEGEWELVDRQSHEWTAPTKRTVYVKIQQGKKIGLSKGWLSVRPGGAVAE